MEWTQFIIMFVGMAGLFAWNRAEARADQRQNQALISAINQEMKDFHGRLEKQDAEFKGKLALQDAEFKTHILHFHQSKEAR